MTPGVFGYIALFIGCILAAYFAVVSKANAGWKTLIFGIFPAGLFGVALSFGTALVYRGCETMKFCPSTTAETIWGVAYPIVFSPAFLVIWLIFASFNPDTKDHSTKKSP